MSAPLLANADATPIYVCSSGMEFVDGFDLGLQQHAMDLKTKAAWLRELIGKLAVMPDNQIIRMKVCGHPDRQSGMPARRQEPLRRISQMKNNTKTSFDAKSVSTAITEAEVAWFHDQKARFERGEPSALHRVGKEGSGGFLWLVKE